MYPNISLNNGDNEALSCSWREATSIVLKRYQSNSAIMTLPFKFVPDDTKSPAAPLTKWRRWEGQRGDYSIPSNFQPHRLTPFFHTQTWTGRIFFLSGGDRCGGSLNSTFETCKYPIGWISLLPACVQPGVVHANVIMFCESEETRVPNFSHVTFPALTHTMRFGYRPRF